MIKNDSKLVDNRTLSSAFFMKPDERIKVLIPKDEEYVEPHRHNYIEMNYVKEGCFEQIIEGRKILSKRGDICFLDTEAVHSIRRLQEGSVLMNLLMRKEFFDGMFLSRMYGQGVVSAFLVDAVLHNRSREHFLLFSTGEDPEIYKRIERISKEEMKRDVGYENIIESEMIIFFTELLRSYRDAQSNRRAEELGDTFSCDQMENSVSIIKILSYIEKNVNHCTLEETAAFFGFHPNYLTTLLKKRTGNGFVSHVQKQRLRMAKLYLKNSDLSVSEIVYLCGYHNLHFFYEKFKREERCTPSEFRKKNR